MIIHLGNPTRAEVISSVLGQLSDGIWENSSAMNKYWMFADVDGTDLDISDKMYDNSYSYYRTPTRNGFYGKSEKEIKDWFANKAKQVVKIWAEDYGLDPNEVWDRNNTDKVTYMGHSSRVPDVTVADVYECYDFLKGRSGKKYATIPIEEPEEEPITEPYEVVDDVVEPKVSGGMNPSQQDVEDFFLDASTRTRGARLFMRRKFTKYPQSYVKASILGANNTKDEWVDYICNKWAEEGVDAGDIKLFREDAEYNLFDQWIDAIEETIGSYQFSQFKKALNLNGYEDYVEVSDGCINNREEAYEWLTNKINEFGNTYFWDDDLKYDLNKLIKKFGNTYFWNK